MYNVEGIASSDELSSHSAVLLGSRAFNCFHTHCLGLKVLDLFSLLSSALFPAAQCSFTAVYLSAAGRQRHWLAGEHDGASGQYRLVETNQEKDFNFPCGWKYDWLLLHVRMSTMGKNIHYCSFNRSQTYRNLLKIRFTDCWLCLCSLSVTISAVQF